VRARCGGVRLTALIIAIPVHVVSGPGLAGSTVATTIMGDDPEATQFALIGRRVR
jgi:hypothetical protein